MSHGFYHDDFLVYFSSFTFLLATPLCAILSSNHYFCSFPKWVMNFPSPHDNFSVKLPCSFPSLNSCNTNCSSKCLKVPERTSSLMSPHASLIHSSAHHCWPHYCWPFYWNGFPWSHKWPSIYQISRFVSSFPQLDLSATLTSLTTLFFLKLFSSFDSKIVSSFPSYCFTILSPLMTIQPLMLLPTVLIWVFIIFHYIIPLFSRYWIQI